MRTMRVLVAAIFAIGFGKAACLAEPNYACPGDVAPPGGNGTVNVDDLLAVINNWGECDGCSLPCPTSCTGDTNGDCVVNSDDQLMVINSWGSCPAEPWPQYSLHLQDPTLPTLSSPPNVIQVSTETALRNNIGSDRRIEITGNITFTNADPVSIPQGTVDLDIVALNGAVLSWNGSPPSVCNENPGEPFFEITKDCERIRIKDIAMQGWRDGVHIGDSETVTLSDRNQHVTIDNCFFTNTTHGIKLGGANQEILITDCSTANTKQYAVYGAGDHKNLQIKDCDFGAAECQSTIRLHGCDGVEISSNTVDGNAAIRAHSGYPFTTGPSLTPNRVRILNNTCSGRIWVGYHQENTGIDDVIVASNYVNQTEGRGIIVERAARNVKVLFNDVYGFGNHVCDGVRVAEFVPGIVVYGNMWEGDPTPNYITCDDDDPDTHADRCDEGTCTQGPCGTG